MPQNLAQKLIESHLVGGKMIPGEEIALKIDQTLLQDATGTMAFLEFESMGLPRVKTRLSVAYVDHNIIQTDFKNADDHLFLQSSAAKFGVIFSPPGIGISHHVHRERFGQPGLSLLGSDSHTTTGGCLAMLAIGAGGLDVALAMASKPFYTKMPKIWGIHLTGQLQPWVSGKDVILELLRRYSVKGGTGKIMEFFGPGVANLDMAARGSISNMAIDAGATAGIWASDQITRGYLRQQGREQDWRPLAADEGATYDEVSELDLNVIEPLVACPQNPDNVKPARELADVPLSQVIVGSSTNGSYRDIMITAQIVKGKHKHPNVSFEINPGSQQVIENVDAMDGALYLFHAGARVHQPGCLGCIGMGQVPATGTNSLRTFPRNYPGRSGLKDDRIYLCSPETAAASALAGRITDPRTLGECPAVPYPAQFSWNPDWFLRPPADGSSVEIHRGPNIKPLPHFEPLSENIAGTVLLKLGDNISTDQIMPAGNRVLPFRSNIQAISDFVFDQVEEGFAQRCTEAGGGVIVAGENYGQGSSREHAALAPRYLGITAKIVKSFARIHRANLINYGIVPLLFQNPADYDAIQQGQKIELPHIRKAVQEGQTEVTAKVNGRPILLKLELTSRERDILRAGGALNWAK